MRSYDPIVSATPEPNVSQIEDAYARLGKSTPESRNVNCGACGLTTCAEMADAIAR